MRSETRCGKVLPAAPHDVAVSTCLACDRENTSVEESCAACGTSLSLKLCGACEAVNDRAAKHCHDCGAELVEAPAEAPAQARSEHARWALTLLALAAAAGFFAYHYYSLRRGGRLARLITDRPVDAVAVLAAGPPAPIHFELQGEGR